MLNKVISMWKDTHVKGRKFGGRCDKDCPCIEGWPEMFLGLEVKIEKAESTPLMANTGSIPRRKRATGSKLVELGVTHRESALTKVIKKRRFEKESERNPDKNMGPTVSQATPIAARSSLPINPGKDMGLSATRSIQIAARSSLPRPRNTSLIERTLQRHEFPVIFDPKMPLGCFFVTRQRDKKQPTVRRTSVCKILSVSPFAWDKDFRLNPGTVVVSAEIIPSTLPSQLQKEAISSHFELQNVYEKAKMTSDNSQLRLWFVNTLQAQFLRDLAQENDWSKAGHWLGRKATSGWPGETRVVQSQHEDRAGALQLRESTRHLPFFPVVSETTMEKSMQSNVSIALPKTRSKTTASSTPNSNDYIVPIIRKLPEKKSLQNVSFSNNLAQMHIFDDSQDEVCDIEVAATFHRNLSPSGNDALSYAVINSNWQQVMQLLKDGAHALQRDSSGKLPLDQVYEIIQEHEKNGRGEIARKTERDLSLKKKCLKIYMEAERTIDSAQNLYEWQYIEIAIGTIKNLQLTQWGKSHPSSDSLVCNAKFDGKMLKSIPAVQFCENQIINFTNSPKSIVSYNKELEESFRRDNNFSIDLIKGKSFAQGENLTLGQCQMSIELLHYHANVLKESFMEVSLPPTDALLSGSIVIQFNRPPHRNQLLQKKRNQMSDRLSTLIDWIIAFRNETSTFVETIDINVAIPISANLSLLHAAVYGTDNRIIKKLLSHGAKLHSQSIVGTALNLAEFLRGESKLDNEKESQMNVIVQTLNTKSKCERENLQGNEVRMEGMVDSKHTSQMQGAKTERLGDGTKRKFTLELEESLAVPKSGLNDSGVVAATEKKKRARIKGDTGTASVEKKVWIKESNYTTAKLIIGTGGVTQKRLKKETGVTKLSVYGQGCGGKFSKEDLHVILRGSKESVDKAEALIKGLIQDSGTYKHQGKIELPRLQFANNWYPGKSERCKFFTKKTGCRHGKDCIYAHVHSSVEPILSDPSFAPPVNELEEIAPNNHVRVKACSNSNGETYFTAAFSHPKDGIIFYADRGILSYGSESGVYWYTDQRSAILAAQRAVYAAVGPKCPTFSQKEWLPPPHITLGLEARRIGNQPAQPQGIDTKSLPWLPSVDWFRKRCPRYNKADGCPHGSNCTSVHVHSGIGQELDEEHITKATTEETRTSIAEQKIQTKNATDVYGRTWYTAAYFNSHSNILFHAERGNGYHQSQQGLYWYQKESDAKTAVRKVYIATKIIEEKNAARELMPPSSLNWKPPHKVIKVQTDLPSLSSVDWIATTTKRCAPFNQKEGCKNGMFCKFLHVSPPLGSLVDDKARCHRAISEIGVLFNAESIEVKEKLSPSFKLYYTAAYTDKDNTIYYAERGAQAGQSSQGVYFYKSPDEAVAAVKRVAALALQMKAPKKELKAMKTRLPWEPPHQTTQKLQNVTMEAAINVPCKSPQRTNRASHVLKSEADTHKSPCKSSQRMHRASHVLNSAADTHKSPSVGSMGRGRASTLPAWMTAEGYYGKQYNKNFSQLKGSGPFPQPVVSSLISREDQHRPKSNNMLGIADTSIPSKLLGNGGLCSTSRGRGSTCQSNSVSLPRSSETSDLPLLNNGWLEGKEEPCSIFREKMKCKNGVFCKLAHVIPPIGNLLDDDAWCRNALGEMKHDLFKERIKTKEALNSMYKLFYTAAYLDHENIVYYAERGSKGEVSANGVHWYPSEEAAKAALRRVVAAAHKQRKQNHRNDDQVEKTPSSVQRNFTVSNDNIDFVDEPGKTKAKTNDLDLPTLSSIDWVEGKSVRCNSFNPKSGGGCRFGTHCRFAHINPPLGVTIENQTFFADARKKLNPCYLKVKHEVTPLYRLMYTAAFIDSKENILYYAERGNKGKQNIDGVWWYNSAEAAIDAVTEVVYAAKSRKTSNPVY